MTRDQKHQKEFDERLAAGKIHEEPVVEIVWPELGTTWVDRVVPNRTLTVTKIQATDRAERNVIGIVRDGLIPDHRHEQYSCSMRTFEMVWRKL